MCSITFGHSLNEHIRVLEPLAERNEISTARWYIFIGIL